ncbi:M14 family metallopeptidase [Spongiimicrobium salis]|uniref:M14 family metallopeptidase n=1 Tax=Spongiimicrobium salis TaxID=1667022 RepID=UPI00374C98CF
MEIPRSKYLKFKEESIQGRYVVNAQILAYLENVPSNFKVETIGYSVLKKPIKMLTIGSGEQKILMWSQMHGNESTTTKATLDLINFLKEDSNFSKLIKKACTLKIILMLNPDGAEVYTRVNANEVDLNRDAQNQTQPESSVLKKVFDDFQPDFCFNLHGQRTIFNVGDSPKSATVSFLTPAFDAERNLSESRERSMKLIAAMNTLLQKEIPGQVGRYDDGFNANCVGDTFQMANVPTILFEAGHFPGDYDREKTREFIWLTLMEACRVIAEKEIHRYDVERYFEIPDNNKLFFDILIHHANALHEKYKEGESVGVLFQEKLVNGAIDFVPKIEKVGDLSMYFGHKVFNGLVNKDLEDIQENSRLFKTL